MFFMNQLELLDFHNFRDYRMELYKFNFFDTIRVFYPDSQQPLAVGPHTKIFIWYVSNPYCNRSFLFNSDRFCTYNLWNFYWIPYSNFVLLRHNFFKLFIYSLYFGSIVYYSNFLEFFIYSWFVILPNRQPHWLASAMNLSRLNNIFNVQAILLIEIDPLVWLQVELNLLIDWGVHATYVLIYHVVDR